MTVEIKKEKDTKPKVMPEETKLVNIDYKKKWVYRFVWFFGGAKIYTTKLEGLIGGAAILGIDAYDLEYEADFPGHDALL